VLLKGRTSVITGANRGIGKALVEVFARNGSNIFACARAPDSRFEGFLEALAKETGTSIWPVYFDLSREEQVKEGAKKILSRAESLDALVCNAGIIHTSLFQMTPVEKMRELFDVNYFAQMTLTQYLSKKMVKQKSGSIIYLSTTAALDGNDGRSAYAASKAALATSAKVLARELAVHSIRVNTIAPGLTETDMMRQSTREDALIATLARSSLKRVGRPEEIANTALFLASDLSSYVTGQVIRVDGGL